LLIGVSCTTGSHTVIHLRRHEFPQPPDAMPEHTPSINPSVDGFASEVEMLGDLFCGPQGSVNTCSIGDRNYDTKS